jgi:hypothetical protein
MVSGYLSVLIQVVLGIVIVLCVYRMSLWMLHQDELIVDERRLTHNKVKTVVVDGYAMSSMATDRVWTTLNPYSSNYAAIVRSFNRQGGAQFTYSFWMSMSNVSRSNVGNKVIFLRGDNRKYTFTKQVTTTPAGPAAGATQQLSDIIAVKCPLIRFGDTFDSFVVEMNTMHNIDERILFSPSSSTESTLRHNALKLGQGRWVMYTFTFQDSTRINDFEDGIVVRFYVNDMLYHTKFVKSAMKQNNGNLYLLPKRNGFGLQDAKIGHFKYFNYALGQAQVNDMYNEGPPRYFARELMGREGAGDPLYLSEYNKMDVYNT